MLIFSGGYPTQEFKKYFNLTGTFSVRAMWKWKKEAMAQKENIIVCVKEKP